ncbi:3-hydroxybutyryl-CoA dehydrogenase [Paracoccus halophilus]|uniref:3-hydroxybutyryl-CoA dehydrogenase n=1 Tax=Paracoccus halophilus TaxID=376733 RepID=A0A099F4C2_9RHOB|nr:3-hydroxyacyl-CoA dehydrogenase [Paracoccus halophilus]KGJ05036.1 3-hydroxybutyryl-CoA dehydrogenase [Paracoccus halophilus]SFA39900.1 3-hydroxybutyryl-CoA dehydrogenase [Paracoccus halophilus]
MINKILVAGGGVMGSQVAWQAAMHGKQVTVYDMFEAGLERCRAFHAGYAKQFREQRGADPAEVEAALARLSYSTDLAAVQDADLVIEQVPEDLEIKRDFWHKVSSLAPERTIFATNTSSLLPSDMLEFVDRPGKFLTLHFCAPVWDANIAEIMMTPRTDPQYRDQLVELAPEMGLVPIVLQKEQPGYVLNSLLIPFLMAALELVRDGVADPASIDKVWHICNRSEIGPLQMMDIVGMNVGFHILEAQAKADGDPRAKSLAEYLKTEFIDKGRMGLETGRGFYDYDKS